MDEGTGCLVAFLGSFAIWSGTLIYTYRKHRDRFVFVLILSTLGGAIGSLIAFLMITMPKSEPPVLGEAGVESCPHCGTAYRTSDYREDAAIFCSDCSQQIRAQGQGQGATLLDIEDSR